MRSITIGGLIGQLLFACSNDDAREPRSDGGTQDAGVIVDASSPTDAGRTDADAPSDAAPNDAALGDIGLNDGGTMNGEPDAAVNDGGMNGGEPDAGMLSCDYRTVDDVLVIEAEDLPLNEDWTVATAEPDYWGTGYILWTGNQRLNNPGSGRIRVLFRVERAGRYRLQWRTQVGMGTSPTDHNDTWVRFPDAEDTYGLSGQNGNESRRYPRPICEDSDFIAEIQALPEVDQVRCVEGSSNNNWFKVYSSGALNWRWSARTSDNDAHEIHFELPAEGTYTLELSARSSYSLIDRIVIHEESVPNGAARDETRGPTPCP